MDHVHGTYHDLDLDQGIPVAAIGKQEKSF